MASEQRKQHLGLPRSIDLQRPRLWRVRRTSSQMRDCCDRHIAWRGLRELGEAKGMVKIATGCDVASTSQSCLAQQRRKAAMTPPGGEDSTHRGGHA